MVSRTTPSTPGRLHHQAHPKAVAWLRLQGTKRRAPRLRRLINAPIDSVAPGPPDDRIRRCVYERRNTAWATHRLVAVAFPRGAGSWPNRHALLLAPGRQQGDTFHPMAHYIAYATEAGTTLPHKMKEQVLAMLTAGVWGVPASAQLKAKLLPGDGLIIAVGAPYR